MQINESDRVLKMLESSSWMTLGKKQS